MISSKRLRQRAKADRAKSEWYKIGTRKRDNFCVLMGPYSSKRACLTDRATATTFWIHSKAVKGERKAHRLFKQLSGVRHFNDENIIKDQFENLEDNQNEATT